MANTTRTLLTDGTGSPDEPPAGWALCIAFDCAQPTARPARVALADHTEVELGRGDARAVTRTGGRLRIDLPNHSTSQVHVRLARDGERWVLRDAGSKNGTYVNGQRVETATVLADGDVIECAETTLVVRRATGGTRGLEEPDARLGPLATLSPALARELAILPKLARSKVPILVRGDTGTGKDVAARAIHELSGRRGAMVAVNCGALPATLIESELFGSRRGAFSGAEDRPGLVRTAEGGTLFLDEIAELPVGSQVALLRLLQNGEVMPLGAGKPVSVDVRVVAATHRPLEDLVERGELRRDLYARLRGHELHLPPLRARLEDLGLLIGALLARLEPDGPPRRFTRTAARALFAHPWPFHVRELEQVLARALAIAEGPALGVAELQLGAVAPAPVAPNARASERNALAAALARHRGNLSAVARELVTSRSQIRRLLDKHALVLEDYKRAPDAGG